MRSIEFKTDNGLGTSVELIDILSTDITAYSTTILDAAKYPQTAAFDTTKSKIGISSYNQWLSNTWSALVPSQRLICVFNSEIDFKYIVINNSHSYGSGAVLGIKNIKIYTTPDTITNTTYGADISNSTLIFDGQISAHVEADVIDDQIITLIQ